jgi:hypothetical protein
MKVAAVVSDLMLYSRIESAARVSGASLLRVDTPNDLPADAADLPELVLVDWSARDPSWTDPLRALRDAGSRVILFGPHTDLEAHAAAKSAGLGPMWARSKTLSSLPALVGGARTSSVPPASPGRSAAAGPRGGLVGPPDDEP